MGQSCDYHIIHSRDLTCARLEKFSCNCQGCKWYIDISVDNYFLPINLALFRTQCSRSRRVNPAKMTTTAATPKVNSAPKPKLPAGECTNRLVCVRTYLKKQGNSNHHNEHMSIARTEPSSHVCFNPTLLTIYPCLYSNIIYASLT